MPGRLEIVTDRNTDLPGPAGKVINLSQANLHSSQKPFSSPVKSPQSIESTQQFKTAAPSPSSYSKLPYGSTSSLASPVSSSSYPGGGNGQNAALTSAASIISTVTTTYQRISVDQVSTSLIDACTNLTLLYAAHSFQQKDSHVLMLLQDIKDEFITRQNDIGSRMDSAFIGKWLWAFNKAVNNLNECVYKMRDARFSAMFTTNTSRKAKIDKYFKSVLVSWQELMVNLSLAMNHSGNTGEDHATPQSQNTQHQNQSLAVDPFQMCLLGNKHMFGYGVPKSYDLAFKYFTAAAKRGSAEAMNMLGCMYEQGLGQTASQSEAMQWYQKASDHSLPDALNNLGRMYEKQQNYQFASDYYVRAARMGHVDAMVSLGYMLENGLGSARNLDKAEEWYALAAAKQYSRAQNCLGSLYYRRRTPEDDQEAVRYFQMSAKQGNAHAMNNLGICYEEGRGVEKKDLMAAKEQYVRSAELNHASGANNLGFVLLLEKNYREAFKWFNIASALGSVDALYNLGTMWESGVLHPSRLRDFAMAKYYYEESCRRGCEKAKMRLTEVKMQIDKQ